MKRFSDKQKMTLAIVLLILGSFVLSTILSLFAYKLIIVYVPELL